MKKNKTSTLKDSDYNKRSSYEKNFKFFRKIKDPRFGDISILQDPKTKRILAMKEKSNITNKKEAGVLIRNAKRKMALRNPNILNLVDYSVTK